MSPQPQNKQSIFAETLPISELLQETYQKLQHQPRSTVACRQLAVIIGHLDIWQKRYMPDLTAASSSDDPNLPYSRNQIDDALKTYRENGYFGLPDEKKQILDWFDNNYVKPRNEAENTA